MSRDGAACRWIVNKTNIEYVEYISRIASVSPLFARVLINRGIKTLEQLNSFLDPDIGKLSDPFELPDIKTALDRIKTAKKLGERVLIHGDYDADGVTATAIMVEGLREFGLDVHYFIPDRMSHGYGFGIAGVERAQQTGAKLVITVDCGITSFEAVSSANACGIDVIITDHHEPVRKAGGGGPEAGGEEQIPIAHRPLPIALSFELPEALAIVNPKIMGSASGIVNLSGAGVAFKIIQGLFGNNTDNVYKLLDLAAIGTAADVVPVIDDNRIIIKEGVKLIHSGQRVGIRALKDAAGLISDFFKMSSLYYMMIPRINAAGRIANATDVVRLLTTPSESEAGTLAKWLNDMNFKRQEIEESVYREALDMLSSMDMNQGALVLASEGWHQGVVGIVASKLAEKYYRPAIVLSIDNGIARGSGRSIPPFDMHHGLSRCKDVLKRFGGHKQAAGLSLRSDSVAEFRAMLSGIIADSLSGDDLIPVLNIDAAVSINDISIGLVDEFARLEPFGCSNSEPVLGAKGLEALRPRIVGNNHLKMQVRQNGRRLDSIGFDFGSMLGIVEGSPLIDAAFLPTINEWDGGKRLQLNLKAIRPSGPELRVL
ncbi:MAG: DHHA1 domain-containing protein [Nitrospirae bacterium]|nr:DHHA1 domain-containing protein [Nitrospirota bacterium]